jgi:hypothetical protein
LSSRTTRAAAGSQLDRLLERFRPVSLEELDERAELLRRLDRKYVLDWDAFASLMERLRPDHDVLDIEGRRRFNYETIYFDTADLRCFRDHVEDIQPRFKARTRHYRDSGECFFEVKLKTRDGETDKRQVEHPVHDRERMTPTAQRFRAEALRDVSIDEPGEVEPKLRTEFERVTLASREGSERLTSDFRVRLCRWGGGERRLRDHLVLLETKSEDCDSPADRLLSEMGVESVSLSKYKVGMAMLSEQGARGEPDEAERFFS